MLRKTKLENIKVTPQGFQFTFDTCSEAEEFLRECQEKVTAAEIKNKKVTLLMPAKIKKTGEMDPPV